ncbi:MAG: arsenosugar biosynthesis radical SAM protein ArsS [Chitinophagales bacterium]
MKTTKTLKYQGHKLQSSAIQLDILNSELAGDIPLFQDKLRSQGEFPLKAKELGILQVNVGKMCNQTCKHCHVDAGPDRKEIMTQSTMDQCLTVLQQGDFHTLDLTGGAPEMNPDFRYFVEQASQLGVHVIVRSNLTIIVANKKYYDLPEFFKNNKVEVVSSLPFYTASRTDAQRGDGVFNASIKAIKMLNAIGYGMKGSDLKLNLVYNPIGSFLPGDQAALEQQYKTKLQDNFNINFNSLFTITNMPISRYLDYLMASDNLENYMDKLVAAYNPNAIDSLMCRNTISVSWDGYMYDCDFNQMLDIAIEQNNHISNFNASVLSKRSIEVNQHCFGCTAGAGSSCGGAIA